jgi:hypothetical protein
MNIKTDRFIDPSKSVWCAACYLRISPAELRTVFRGKDYHRHCFHKMVAHNAETRSSADRNKKTD